MNTTWLNSLKLNSRVQIVGKGTARDEEGNIYETGEVEKANVWAYVEGYAAKISNGYAETVSEIDYRIIFRYRHDMNFSSKDKFKYAGLTLEPLGEPINSENKWLIVECKALIETKPE